MQRSGKPPPARACGFESCPLRHSDFGLRIWDCGLLTTAAARTFNVILKKVRVLCPPPWLFSRVSDHIPFVPVASWRDPDALLALGGSPTVREGSERRVRRLPALLQSSCP